MKKFYFFAVALFMSLGIAFSANAEVFSFTIEWDTPGALTLKKGWGKISLDSNATSYTYEAADEWAANIVVNPASGFQIDEAYKMVDGVKTTINPTGVGYSLSLSDHNGATIHFVTSKMGMDATVTINVAHSPKTIMEASFAKSGTSLTSFQAGSQTLEFSSALDSEITIIPTWEAWVMEDGEKVTRKFYSIKKNGADAQSFYQGSFNQYYVIPVANGDVIDIVPLEEDPNAGVNPEDLVCKVGFDFSQSPAGILSSIFYDGKFYQLSDLTDGTLTVDRGSQVRVNLNEDYTVLSATYAGEPVLLSDSTIKFTANQSGTLVVVAQNKEYGTYTYTAYVVCPEGISLANGNQLTGDFADLTGGEIYNQDLDVPAGEGVPAFTIPAGQLYKVTLNMSAKYDQLSLTAKGGYWIKAARKWDNLSTELEPTFSHSSTPSVLIVAKKITHDATATVYIDKAIDPASVQLRPNRTLGAYENRTFSQAGFNTFTFDSEFEPGFKVTCNSEDLIDNSGSSPKANYLVTVFESGTPVGGTNMVWDSENVCYGPATISDGALVQIYPELRKNVKISRERFACADVSYGPGMTPVELSTPGAAATVKAYSLTDIHIYTDPGSCAVVVDGDNQTLEDGYAKVTVEDSHKIVVKYTGEDPTQAVFTPAAGSETDSLAEILISFPNATSVEIADGKTAEEIRFSCYDIWAPIHSEIEKVENAEVPTFKFSCTPVPTMPYEYSLMIPADFFIFNYADCAVEDICASFTLKGSEGELEYAFEPSVPIDASFTDWGIWVGVIFDEDKYVQSVDNSKISVTWNGVPVPAEDYIIDSNYNMLMIGVTGEDYLGKTGELYVKMEEGAATVNGTPSPALENTWKVVSPVDFVYSLNHNNGIDMDANTFTIHVTFPNYESVELFNENGATLQETGLGGNNYFETATITKVTPQSEAVRSNANVSDHTFALTFKLPSKDTSYSLNVHKGTFVINGFQESEPIEQTYSFDDITSGISDVILDLISDGKVYNLQGVRMSAKWSQLPAGVYIVNGVKTVKR